MMAAMISTIRYNRIASLIPVILSSAQHDISWHGLPARVFRNKSRTGSPCHGICAASTAIAGDIRLHLLAPDAVGVMLIIRMNGRVLARGIALEEREDCGQHDERRQSRADQSAYDG